MPVYSGTLNLVNYKVMEDRLRLFLEDNSFVYVEAYSDAGWRPRIKLDQRLDELGIVVRAKKPATVPYVHILISMEHSLLSLYSTQQSGSDEHLENPFLTFRDKDTLEIKWRAPSGILCYFVFKR
jgi:hypothetical protein